MPAEEAPNYNLWHPRLWEDGALVFNITPGEQASPPVASDEFMKALFETFQLSGKPRKMDIFTYRTSYHSEPDAFSWEDQWPLNWRITLHAATPIKSVPNLKNEYIGTIAFDPAGMDEDPPSECACLIISDFESVAAADRCRKKLADAESVAQARSKYNAPEPQFERIILGDSLVQEQINLGVFPTDFFEKGAKYAAVVEKACRGAGGITSFEERAAERDELYDPEGIE